MENKGRFKKGHIPWIKGKKGIHLSPDTEFKKGAHSSPDTEFKKGQCSGNKNRNWKGGRRKLTIGYIMINVPNHPRAYRNEVYEHIIVVEKKLGRYLNKGEVVHHINGIKDDNTPGNLIVCKNNSEHRKLHKLKTWSRLYNQCKNCSTFSCHHEGHGLCKKCYGRSKYVRKNSSNNILYNC